VLQLGVALVWVFVFSFKAISFGLLAWNMDQLSEVRLPAPKQVHLD
jgi:hypothetical protein